MSSSSSEADGDFELNIAPIVDCFTVLIAYLLVSMSFISLGIIEAGVAATGDAPAEQIASTPPEIPISLSIALGLENKLTLNLTGGPTHLNQVVSLPASASLGFDLDSLKANLQNLKGQYATLTEINVSADNTIRYKQIVKVLEAVKTQFPKVFLASS